jgi:hypothetical protein
LSGAARVAPVSWRMDMDNQIRIIDIAYEVRDMVLEGHRMVEALQYVRSVYGVTRKECKEIESIARVGGR